LAAPTEPLQVRIDVEALVRAMPVLKQPGSPGRGRGLRYFSTKHTALLAFFGACQRGDLDLRHNAYLRWMDEVHGPSPYHGAVTTEERVQVCARFAETFDEAVRDGIREPIRVEGDIQLPGVLDGGHRLAMLRVLRVRTVLCEVNGATYGWVRELRIEAGS